MFKKMQFVKNLKKDELVNDIFVVKFKKPVDAYKNGYKFELRVGDSTKEIMFKYWGSSDEAKVKSIYDLIQKDDVVLISGRVNEWNNKLEISSGEQYTLKQLKKDEFDQNDFLKRANRPAEDMYKELLSFVDSIQNQELKKILNYFFRDEKFSARFNICPAAMYIHHNWISGLLEHSIAVAKIAENIQKIHSGMDRDLVIAGALLHDIGKVDEFSVTTNITVSTEGMLIGHLNIGVQMLTRAMDELKTPKELNIKVIHMMITHMGEYGGSKLPSFPEAMAVYLADNADQKLTQMITLKEEAVTEDDSIYHKDFGNIYLK